MHGLIDRIRGWLSTRPNDLKKNSEALQPATKSDGIDAAVLGEIASAMVAAEEIVIFTGAGMSAESGIPTFRDGATGLWNNIDPETVASIRGFEDKPDLVWDWHVQMRKLIDACRPNPGHHAIANLERQLFDKRFTVVTQNIDGFHQIAGNSRVFELHGSIRRLRCHRNCSYVDLWHTPDQYETICPQCGAPVRPDVILFGEPLNEDLFSYAEAAALNADVLITVGTSASVRPAGGLPLMAKMSGAMVVEVNPHETPFSPQATYAIRTSASEFFNRLLVRVG